MCHEEEEEVTRVQRWRRGLGFELRQSRSVLFSPLPYGAIKGQNPLEVPVRRGGQDLSLLQNPASS